MIWMQLRRADEVLVLYNVCVCVRASTVKTTCQVCVYRQAERRFGFMQPLGLR